MKVTPAMVDRFLSWRLPNDFSPDAGISFTPSKTHPDTGWPIGTNLFTADQAKAMLEHVLADAGDVSASASIEPHLLIEAAAIGMSTIIARVGVYESLSPYMKEKYDRLSELHRLGCDASRETKQSHERAHDEGYPGIAHDLETMRQFVAAVRALVSDGPFGLTDSPKSLVSNLQRLLAEIDATPANVAPSEPYLHPILAAQRGTPAYEAEKAALSSTAFSDERVMKAMQDAWNEWVIDTGCFPDDFRLEGKKLFFEAGAFAIRVAENLRAFAPSAIAPIVKELVAAWEQNLEDEAHLSGDPNNAALVEKANNSFERTRLAVHGVKSYVNATESTAKE